MMTRIYTVGFLLVLMSVQSSYAAGFVAVYLDGAGEGYNDLTSVTSDITGQTTTLGADRKACLEAAMVLVATHLDITVDIRVEAEFNSLGGTAFGAILGGAGPNTVHSDYTNAPVASMYFVAAEANQHQGSDLSGSNDIGSEFNSDVDGSFVLGTTTWYYGIDGDVPANHIDFYSTAIHELCHGLGFLSLMTGSSGQLFGEIMDIYTSFLRREGSVNLDYTSMNNAQRASGNISVDELVWKGSIVEAEHGSKPLMYAPNPLQSGSSVSHWDTSHSPNLVMEPSATDAFTDISLERQLFDDIHWPLISLQDPLDPDNVFTDFSAGTNGNGASTSPFDNLTESVAAANTSAFINIDTSSSTETFTSGSALGVGPKALTLLNNTPGSGVVTVGAAVPPSNVPEKKAPDSGFVTRE